MAYQIIISPEWERSLAADAENSRLISHGCAMLRALWNIRLSPLGHLARKRPAAKYALVERLDALRPRRKAAPYCRPDSPLGLFFNRSSSSGLGRWISDGLRQRYSFANPLNSRQISDFIFFFPSQGMEKNRLLPPL